MNLQRKQILDEKGHLRNTSVWSIEIDYTNLAELEELSKLVRIQISTVKTEQSEFLLHNQKKRKIFESCKKIWDTDISDLYEDIILDESPVYYVYAHSDPSRKIAVGKNGKSSFGATIGMKCLPFYIGQGKENRAYDLNRNETHRKERQRLKEFDKDIEVTILKSGLTEKESLMLEAKLIDIFGIKAFGGNLVNLDEGIKSKERKEKYIESLKEILSIYKEIYKESAVKANTDM